ncbi:MAG: HEAT repeat domain-containing protein [Calditrichaeota bacterium]|nr:HEAT repeat domain-containing protein [Calditrichota bacterium]
MLMMKKFLPVAMTFALLALIFVSAGFAQQEKNYDQYLIKALKDKNLGIRASAAQLLGERRAEEAMKPLLKLLKQEKCYACRIIAAQALYKIGNKSVLPELKRIMKNDRNKTVRHVVKAIVLEMEKEKLAER